jgi:hypothetical protein
VMETVRIWQLDTLLPLRAEHFGFGVMDHRTASSRYITVATAFLGTTGLMDASVHLMV